MKKSTKFLHFTALLVPLAVLAGLVLEMLVVITILFSLLLLIAYILYKEEIGQELIIAFLFAVALTSYYVYEYSSGNILVGRVNLFPLIAWTAGLVLTREIYENLKGKHKVLKVYLFYLGALLLIEFLGFHVINIQLASNYPSLFGLGVIHAPPGMKAFYLSSGLVYILVTDYLKVK
jgi:hypothetical protein